MAPDNAPIGVDVERRLGKPKGIDEPLVDQAVLRIQEKNHPIVTGTAQEKAQPQRHFDEALERRVGAGDHPGKNIASVVVTLPSAARKKVLPRAIGNLASPKASIHP
jgi:hypothetical protein